MKKKYYIATAIAYASGKPHVGNTYEIILADAIARFKRLEGYDVYFQTGTDEHGLKIETKAKEVGLEPQAFVDLNAKLIKDVWDKVNSSYDNFVRTTNNDHKEEVSKIFKKLYDQGDIYKGQYEGLYCTACESFFTESQLIDGKCPDCGLEVKVASEEAYFLKLSNYSKRLEEHINNHPEFLQPESRKNEIINNFIKPGLQDLCVSRTSFKWGVPISFDEGHIVYVWLDALSNYITFLGYKSDGNSSENFKRYWPADIQLIGKDIFRFHAIYWPIMLMALNVEVPKKVFGHPWVLTGQDKMSKSKGNLLYADDLVDIFGLDAVRYYLLHEIPFAQDGTITYELIIDRFNSDLANNLGNLVNRTISMNQKYFNGLVVNKEVNEEIDNELKTLVLNTKEKVVEKMNDIKVGEALSLIFKIFERANKYIDETMPWALAKDETKQERLQTVLYNLEESIRQGAVLLSAFLPDTATNIFNQLNTKETSFESLNYFGKLEQNIVNNTPTPLFIRIDKEKKLKELEEQN